MITELAIFFLAELPEADRGTILDMFVKPAIEPIEYLERVDAVHAAIAGPMIDVQYGPAGVQWCSRALLEAMAA